MHEHDCFALMAYYNTGMPKERVGSSSAVAERPRDCVCLVSIYS